MKVMIVDDEAGPLTLFMEYIVDSGISCEPYRQKPLEAIEMVKKNKYDAVFMDIHMQINSKFLDGIALSEELVRIDPALKVFFVTGFSYDEVAIKSRLAGNLIKICHKPFSKVEVQNWFRALKMALEADSKIFIQTMGEFCVFVRGERVKFDSAKSEELLAYIVHCHGNAATRDRTASLLWGNLHKTSEKIYASLKNERYVLKRTLDKYNLSHLVIFERERMRLNLLPNISCDSWDLVQQGVEYTYAEYGDYMRNYDWNDEGFCKYPLEPPKK